MQTEKEVIQTFAANANVAESYPLYDTVLVCHDFYGQEANVRGWYTSFAAFAAQEEHHFFTTRNESTASLPYCNLQSADSMDFAFMIYNIGLRFFGPAPNICGEPSNAVEDPGEIIYLDPGVAHFWSYDLPNHISISLKTQQDTRIELTGYACPPGYGPTGGGAALNIPVPVIPNGLETPIYYQRYQMNMFGTQGIAVLTNRFKLPSPIGIPRTGIVEGVLKLSEYARYVLGRLYGPTNYFFAEDDNPTTDDSHSYNFAQRFGIQFSLFGKRLVQQRGQYFA